MKKLTILKSLIILMVAFVGISSVFGQANSARLSATADSLFMHGWNSTNNDSSSPASASEATDSVTRTAVLPYFVMPDLTVSPSYDPSTSYTANLNANATFTWTLGGGGITSATHTGMAANFVDITFSTLGAKTISVVEGNSSTTCSDATPVSFPVLVIAAPTAEFAGASEAARCIGGTDGALTQTFTASTPIRFASSVSGTRNLVVTYNITCNNGGFTAVTGATANITETGAGTGTFTIPTTLTHFGNYTVTITAINDRISTKSHVAGSAADVNTDATTQSTYALTINRVPVTGSIYHVPNM
jgi:hypothetical protein